MVDEDDEVVQASSGTLPAVSVTSSGLQKSRLRSPQAVATPKTEVRADTEQSEHTDGILTAVLRIALEGAAESIEGCSTPSFGTWNEETAAA
uniref:Uncharacterized protein n=1 Tax=Noctiluca scintillans TaxID=2966 RepID=A0A7S1AE62_NOCSC